MARQRFDKVHYSFNPHTLKYEKVVRDWRYYLKRVFGILGLGVASGALFFFLYITFIQSPVERQLVEENNMIRTQFKVLNRQLDDAIKIMEIIEERDDNFYRVMLEADSIPISMRKGTSSLTARYDKWKNLRVGDIVKETTQKMDVLNRMLYIQSSSFDELVDLALKNEDRLKHIPAIMPVMNKDLKRTASGYGYRIDPIYQTKRFHKGMDFSAEVGTEIYATGAGTVTFAGWKQGYGNCVMIDHGYDYETLYAHCSKIKKGLRRGSKVQRGDVIAYVGNTGKSTGPHLHYEVHVDGQPQNPSHYYYLDLSPDQYDEMIRIASDSGKMFD
ncbi:MAG: M23 family metallopeptidase [Paludibacteraceae bacterium]|nr:M23 family metallopeptidase [Paludibacteraceae bacterium]